jgi:hypothetical protein
MIRNLTWAAIGLNTGVVGLGIFFKDTSIVINGIVCGAAIYLGMHFSEIWKNKL